MTDLEKLYAQRKEERQNYERDLAVYESKIEEAVARIKSYEDTIRANASKLRPDLRDMVLNALTRTDDKVISREYFESIRKLYMTLERVGMNILNGNETASTGNTDK